MVEIKEFLAPIVPHGARSGRKLSGFVGVTIHNTGNYSKGADALNHAKYLQGNGAKVQSSWHYAVDDSLITRSIPEDEIAWHAGDGGNGTGNTKTIAIEICVNPECDLQKATDNAAELAADILKRHSISRADGHVFQHNNWSGKNCPAEIRKGNPYSWQTFIDKVNQFLIPKTKAQSAPGKLYKVQVGAYSDKDNAAAMLEKLKSAGFDGYIKYE